MNLGESLQENKYKEKRCNVDDNEMTLSFLYIYER